MRRRIVSWVVFAVLCVCSHLALAEEKPAPSWMFPPEVLIFGDVSMIPLTPLAEQIGATLSEDLLTHHVTLTRKGSGIVFTPDKNIALVNGRPLSLPKAPFTRNGVTYVPLRQCIEALGGTVETHDTQNTASIVLPDMETPLACYLITQSGGSNTFLDNDSELFLVNLDGAGMRRLTYSLADEDRPTMLPGADMLMYTSGGWILLFDTAMKKSCGIPPPNEEGNRLSYVAPVCSADGRRVVFGITGYADDTSRIGLYTISEKVQVLGEGHSPYLSPDGQSILFSRYKTKLKDSVICVMDFEGHVRETVGRGSVEAINPAGSLLVATRYYYEKGNMASGLVVYRLKQNMQMDKVYEMPPAQRFGFEIFGGFSPDGTQILFTHGDGIYLMHPDRSNIRQLRTCPFGVDFATFTPDGTKILFAESDGMYSRNHLCLMDADGRNVQILTSPSNRFRFQQPVTFTPDGTQFICSATIP